jgi:N utilization substance protein B
MLYQAEIGDQSIAAAIVGHWSIEPEPDGEVRRFAEGLVRAVESERARIDELIAEASHHWRIERMDAVERNILRLAVGELRQHPDTPAAVILDEAVDLARGYGGSESHAFVNGILEAVRKRLLAGA